MAHPVKDDVARHHRHEAHGQRDPPLDDPLAGERGGAGDRQLLGNGHAEARREQHEEDAHIGEMLNDLFDHVSGKIALAPFSASVYFDLSGRSAVQPRTSTDASGRVPALLPSSGSRTRYGRPQGASPWRSNSSSAASPSPPPPSVYVKSSRPAARSNLPASSRTATPGAHAASASSKWRHPKKRNRRSAS